MTWVCQQFASTWELHRRCPAATLRCFWILLKELSRIACDMYGKTFSRNDLKHIKDPTDRFQSSFRFVLLDLIRLSFGFPLLLDCYIARHFQKLLSHDASWRTNTEPRCSSSQPKTEPRGSQKWSLAAWNGKNALAAVPKKTGGAEVYRSTCAKHHKNPDFFSGKAFLMPRWVKNVKWSSLTCFAAFPDCQFCSHWFAACAEPPRV